MRTVATNWDKLDLILLDAVAGIKYYCFENVNLY